MKFQVDQKELVRALRQVKKYTEAKTMPILGSVVISTDLGKVYFAATDLEVAIQLEVDAQINQRGKVVVPAKEALALAVKLKGLITVESAEDDRVLFKSEEQGISATLAGSPFDEFPTLPEFELDGDWVSAQPLARALKAVSHAVSKDETRYNLNGVCIDADGESTVRCIATDGHRLAVADAGAITLPWSGEVILPRRAVKLLIPLIGKAPMARIAKVGNNLLQFAGDGWRMDCRLIEGEFPNWKQVVPKQIEETLQVDRSEFEQNVKAMTAVSSTRNHAVKFVVNGDIRLSTTSEECGEAQAVCACDRAQGQPELVVVFNGNYLLDALKTLEGEKLHIAVKDATSPIRLSVRMEPYPFCIVMPMRV